MTIYLYHQLSTSNSINIKAVNQCNYLNSEGLNVNLILVVFDSIDISGLDFEYSDAKTNFIPVIESNIFLGIGSKLMRQWELRKIFVNFIKNLSHSDIVYMRYPYPLLYMLKPLSRHKRKCVIVTEHNTKELQEYRLRRSFIQYVVELIFGNRMRNGTDGIIGVTNEITSYEILRYVNSTKPHITIGNGINTGSVPIRKYPESSNNELHILFVGNISRWHGLDRLLHGLATYRGTPRVMLHVAGDGAELPYLRKLADALGVSDQVIFYGYLMGEALDTLFDRCHLAVGSLGIHRKGLSEASTLKAREYCCRGIPFIIADKDPDFPLDFPYILRLPGDESSIDINMIIAFAEKICSDPDHAQKMRRYAEKYLDWSVKIKSLDYFLGTLINESTGK